MANVLDPQQGVRKPPTITPVGDVPAATARAATPSATALSTPPAASAVTPPTNWKSLPGAQRTFFPKQGPLGSAADRLASAPNFDTTPGAAHHWIDPPVPTRGATVPPSPTGGSTLSLAEPPVTAQPAPAPVAPVGEDVTAQFVRNTAAARQGVDAGGMPRAPQPMPQTVPARPVSPPGMSQPSGSLMAPPASAAEQLSAAPAPVAAAPTTPAVGEDISGDFAKRTAAARKGVNAGGMPRAVTPGQAAAVNDNLAAATSKVAPTVEAAAPKAPLAERAGAAAGKVTKRAVRLGAAPVETTARTSRIGKMVDKVPGLKKTEGGGSAAALALAAIPSALASLNTDTSDYYTRLGVTPGGDGIGGLAKDVGVRAAGVLSDFGAAIPDTLIGMANGTGLTDIRPFGSYFADREGQYKPHYATDAGGMAVRPSSLSAADQAANEQFTVDQLKTELAARTGQGAPAAPATNSRQQLAQAPAAPTAPGAAPVQFITPDTSGAIAPPDASGHQLTGAEAAMDSTARGTAVINGQVKSAADIANAAKRLNTVPSSAFTDSTVGGPTLSTEQAVGQRVAALRDSRAASALAQAPGSDGGDSQAQQTVQELMGSITDALRNGKKATARLLISQLGTYGQIAGGNADRAQRGQQAPKTAAELAQEQAQALLTGEQATQAQLSTQQAKRLASIQQQLAVETDPAKRKTLMEDAQALSGKGSAADKLMTLEVPVGTGLNAQTLHLPYDPATNQLLIPNGYAELLQGLQGSQPQAK